MNSKRPFLKSCILAGLVLVVKTSAAADDKQVAVPVANQGQLITAHLESAPFPHPARAEGHKYKEEVYSAADHYSDNTVGIFIPKGFRETGRIDFVVHFHGWHNNVAGALRQYKLADQLVQSKRNAVLVVPQGPRDAPDSFGGKLEDPDGFNRFMNEVAETVRQKATLKNKKFEIGQILLSGHSGGYRVISAILDHGGLTDKIQEVWLFDALYAETDRFLAWTGQGRGRLLNIYTDDGGTKKETEQMMATLKQRGTTFFMGNEAKISEPDLRNNRLIFIHTEMEHNEVLEKHRTFRDFLETSRLQEIRIRNK